MVLLLGRFVQVSSVTKNVDVFLSVKVIAWLPVFMMAKSVIPSGLFVVPMSKWYTQDEIIVEGTLVLLVVCFKGIISLYLLVIIHLELVSYTKATKSIFRNLVVKQER
jgi:hypothetical protein